MDSSKIAQRAGHWAGADMNTLANRTVRVAIPLILLCGALSGQVSSPAQTSGGEAISTPAVEAPKPKPLSDAKPHDDSFVIGADDSLAINVWKEPELSRTVMVRSDGKISLPLMGEMIAAGRTPLQLEKDISIKLQSFITEPQVTVMVQQINSEKYNILGQVQKPGAFPLTTTTTIVDAIAIAGGFRDFAKKKAVYILRQNTTGGESRLVFNYQDYIRGKNVSQNILLKPHDTIIVP
jgi:polysaccharide export outer membrane protein